MTNRYSWNRRDKKIAGVASTLGDIYNVDPTFIRIAFAALGIMVSFKLALVAYIAAGIFLHVQRNRAEQRLGGTSEFDRMADIGKRRTSVHDLRTELDENDRRMMAIDHHLNTQNEELAREIEALRQEK